MDGWPHDRASFMEWFKDREPGEVLSEIADHFELNGGVRWIGAGKWGQLAGAMSAQNVLAGRLGWVDDQGRFLSCGHAAHEFLLNLLDHDIRDIEQRWVRVGMSRVHMYDGEPNEAQAKTLMRLLDEGVLMPGAAMNLKGKGWT